MTTNTTTGYPTTEALLEADLKLDEVRNTLSPRDEDQIIWIVRDVWDAYTGRSPQTSEAFHDMAATVYLDDHDAQWAIREILQAL